jgi:hypothetical protein
MRSAPRDRARRRRRRPTGTPSPLTRETQMTVGAIRRTNYCTAAMSSRRKRRRERQRRHQTARVPRQPSPHADELRKTEKVERLAYSRRQAAEALGVSVSTIDRRVVPAIGTVKTPWGQRLIPIVELERFLVEHMKPARPRPAPRPAGRPPTLPTSTVDRILREYATGKTLGEIARSLTTDRVPTAHSGRQWWPSTVRAVLARATIQERTVASRP